MTLTDQQRSNLDKLATYLESLPATPPAESTPSDV